MFLPSLGLLYTWPLQQESFGFLTCEKGLNPQGVTARKSWEEKGFHCGLFTLQVPGPTSVMSLEVEPGTRHSLELPRPSPCMDLFFPQKTCTVDSLSSLSRILEPTSGISQPAPVQGPSCRAWPPTQSSTAWWCGRAGSRVSYLSPTWEPRHLAFVSQPSFPRPQGPGAAFLFHFGQEE